MKVVRWREPAAVKRAREGTAGPAWPKRLAAMMGIAAVVLIGRAVIPAIQPAPFAPPWPLMILIALGAGAVLGFFIPWFTSMTPSEIIVSPKGINRNGFKGARIQVEFWPWERIGRLCVEATTLEDARFDTLVIYGKGDERIGAIGLAIRTPLTELESFAAGYGKALERTAG